MAGRPPKPTSLKIVGGNAGKRAINKQEPDPTYIQDLTAPEWLPTRAKIIWNEIAPNLSAAKLLTNVDIELLSQGCVAVANYRLSTQKSGEDLVKGGCGEKGENLNPWMIVQSMSFKQAMAVFQQFGMSPAARTRIAIQPQGDLFGGENKAATYF